MEEPAGGRERNQMRTARRGGGRKEGGRDVEEGGATQAPRAQRARAPGGWRVEREEKGGGEKQVGGLVLDGGGVT